MWCCTVACATHVLHLQRLVSGGSELGFRGLCPAGGLEKVGLGCDYTIDIYAYTLYIIDVPFLSGRPRGCSPTLVKEVHGGHARRTSGNPEAAGSEGV